MKRHKTYHIQLSFRMVVALGDLANDYLESDSPSVDLRTVGGLTRRGLVMTSEGDRAATKLTKQGRLYLDLALNEMAKNRGWVKETRKKDRPRKNRATKLKFSPEEVAA